MARRPLVLATAMGLGVATFGSFVWVDLLCPEHRLWVQVIGTSAMFGAVGAIVGLLRRWAIAPALTLAVAMAGVVIGLVDVAHAPGRGRLIAGAFVLIAVAAAWISGRQVVGSRWARRINKGLMATMVLPDDLGAGVRPGDRPASEAESSADRDEAPTLTSDLS